MTTRYNKNNNNNNRCERHNIRYSRGETKVLERVNAERRLCDEEVKTLFFFSVSHLLSSAAGQRVVSFSFYGNPPKPRYLRGVEVAFAIVIS